MKEHSRGFTIVEILAVLALISILTLTVLARRRTSNTNLAVRTQVLKAHLRYAQSRAMDNDNAWGIEFTHDGKSYRLFMGDDQNADRQLPGEDPGPVDLAASGLSVDEGDLVVAFDTWGRPCSDATASTPYTTNQTLTLSDTDGSTGIVTVTRNTGYIP